ncbi:MAG: PilC/PilY family type IV pilus protein [Aquabacterium sp.]|uniref:pilus assembly protein n=1 Tax=Aquabacterium sp. TaxID=1872578 RepID=UPI002715E691|nr:PilC/PilY family type IV pilus protein [Aquabacterium sp.]MDO9005176.1 PilC/PilY family type IV pilus protein [Aquabacterium sp.]
MNIKTLMAALMSLALWAPGSALSAATDLANEPLATLVTTKTKPNILFILDNSGSMGWDYMPDDVKDAASSYITTYGYKSAQCNGVAYDPTYPYEPPVKEDGSPYPNASFTAANPNGFGPTLKAGTAYYSDSTVTTGTGSKSFVFKSGFLAGLFNGFNFLGGLPGWSIGDTITAVDANDDNHWVIGTITGISNSGICLFSCTRTVTINVTSYNGTDSAGDWKVNEIQVDNLNNSTYYQYTGTQTRMGWTYTSSGVEDTTFKRECISHPGNPTGEAGDGKFTGVVLTTGSDAVQKQRYANWYQYYRTRMLMMRTAAGRAFQPLSNQYRVGFSTINNTGITESSSLSTISAGNAFLNVRDYDSTQRSQFMYRLYNTTPSGGTPLRTALSKAGRYFAKQVSGQSYDAVQYACQRNYAFLSTDGYWNDSGNPKQLDGITDIGQQDGADVRPFSDGGTSTKVTKAEEVTHEQTTTPVTVSQQYRYETYTYVSTGCFFSFKETVTPRTFTSSISGNLVVNTDKTTTTTVNAVTTAGTTTSTTSVAGPVTSTSSSSPTPPTPTYAAAWVVGTPVASNTCGAKRTTPGAIYPVNSQVITPTGSAVTVSLPTTTTGPTVTSTGGSGGSSNSLADVAEYYYNTDLRTSALGNCTAGAGGSGDVCDNSQMKAADSDTATWQHMSTFTLGLGVNGTLAYDPSYLARAGDITSTYYKILKGDVNWPTPTSGNATTIDDLWHAGVNGRGEYFGAKNPTALTAALNSALGSMNNVPGAGAAVGPTDIKNIGSNYLDFGGSYATVKWTGNLVARTKDGAVRPLNGRDGVENLARRATTQTDRRNIYYGKNGSPDLKSFTFTNLNSPSDGLGSNFTGFCNKYVADTGTVLPQQCVGLDTTKKNLANDGEQLVNWLRGHVDYEMSNPDNPLFRKREKVLGDIVGSQPVYVAGPSFPYADAGYADFQTLKAGRTPVVYVGANDGMLHAFSAADDNNLGKELWAFVPTSVMPRMYRLANTDYANNHQYFVDGTPVIGDISVGGVWKTILVGGLNSGGKGIYALDITDPASPKMLWEFSQGTGDAMKDADLGYTHGKPIITKLASGTWVVAFASGYNNVSTGKGYLYVRNAYSGASVAKVATTAGSAATPSGLAHLSEWVDSVKDNTAKRYYGGDMLGNLWRFTLTENAGVTTGSAQRLAVLQINATTPQPITIRPELAEVTSGTVKYPVVLVGTGRYLGSTDQADTTRQAIYGIKDPLTATDWGDVRADARLKSATVTSSGTADRTATTSALNWATDIGWRVDLMLSKERVNVEMEFQYTTLVVAAGVPGAGGVCSAGKGSGWLYEIDVETGAPISTDGVIARYLGEGMPVGLVWSEGGDGDSGVMVSKDDGSTTRLKVKTKEPPGPPQLRRASWRELVNN